MPQFLRIVCFYMLIHLHATAGESIIISRLNTCKPVISVQLNTDMMNELKTDLQQKSEKVLAVYMVVKGKPSTTAIAGRYSINGDKLSFTPVYALGYNIEFEIQYRTGTNTIIKHFTTPKHPLSEQTANVVTAYPLSDTIPYNTLFFHVRFSHSMKNDKLAYTHISIYDEAGIEREKAWRQKSFWLDDGKLLVLMIHPGRVKNGIHYESPLFDSGKTYTLKVNEDIEDINGNSIAKSYSKTFYVIGEDRVSPKPYFENAALPTAGSKQPLLLTFSESMDYASVFAGVKLYNVKGKEVALSIKNKTDDSYMLFPNRQWVKGKYTLILKGAVYDIAANRINRLFEITDVNEIKKDQRRTEWSFEIK